jgi:peroxiredoxin Q/BCP
MKIPSFSVPDQDGNLYTDKHFSDGRFLLYLYPKDMTSGCTIEAQDFRDLASEFESLGVRIFGLSKDSPRSHCKFIEKENLNFTLLADESTELIQALDAWKEKSMYGKTYFGTERCTFFIEDGEIIHEWRNVKARGHAAEVLSSIQNEILDS